METKFNFNSQICTTREQSDRLLALGLNKETADCALLPLTDEVASVLVKPSTNDIKFTIPAWSLERLLEMLPGRIPISEDLPAFHHYAYLELSKVSVELSKVSVYYCWEDYDGEERLLVSFCGKGFFTAVVDAIEWLIKEGHFNKEYLIKITSQGNTSTGSAWTVENGIF